MLMDLEGAPLAARDRAMLRYARKLTRHPYSVTPMDIADLRGIGYSDAAIADIALNTALFAAWNRIVDGLGGALHPAFLEDAERLRLPHAWAGGGEGHNGHNGHDEEGGTPAPVG